MWRWGQYPDETMRPTCTCAMANARQRLALSRVRFCPGLRAIVGHTPTADKMCTPDEDSMTLFQGNRYRCTLWVGVCMAMKTSSAALYCHRP